MKSSDKKTTPVQKQNAQEKVTFENQTWQSSFSKRLPHRIGQPLSSGGGGDGGGITPSGYEESKPA